MLTQPGPIVATQVARRNAGVAYRSANDRRHWDHRRVIGTDAKLSPIHQHVDARGLCFSRDIRSVFHASWLVHRNGWNVYRQ